MNAVDAVAAAAPAVPLPWRARLRRWFRPPRTLKVTRMGRTYLVLTVGVGFGALNTGNNLLYLLLGLMLATIVTSGVLSERVLRGVEVRRLGADAAYAAEPFGFRWALFRKQGYGFGLLISEETGVSGGGVVGVLPPGTERIVRAELTAPRRGPVALTGVKITTAFPFGLFEKTRVFELTDTLLVYPRRGFACDEPRASERGPLGDAGDPRRSDGSGDLLGLREVAPGEDVRRVHWVKSAAAGKLLRTLREREERESYLLEVDPGMSGEALDRRCEEASALAQRLLSRGHEVGLTAGSFRLRPGTGTGQQKRILRALAMVGHGELS